MLTVHLESIALPVMQPAHYVRRPALFPIAHPFFKIDVAPIVQIAHADWLQSLRELVPIFLVFFCRVCFLSSFLSSCYWWLCHLGESTTCDYLDSAICRRLCTYFAELSRSQKTLCLIITGYPTFPVSPLHLAFYVSILCQPPFCT